MKLRFHPAQFFLAIFFIPYLIIGCSPGIPEKLVIEKTGTENPSMNRFQIISITTTNPISKDVLIDTLTGDTWSLHFSPEAIVNPDVPPMGAHLNWEKIRKDDRTANDRYLQTEKLIEGIKNQKDGKFPTRTPNPSPAPVVK